MGTFVVSAVMHEVIMYYMGRVGPSFRMTWFFVVNGLGVAVEVAVKKVVDGRWALPAVVSSDGGFCGGDQLLVVLARVCTV